MKKLFVFMSIACALTACSTDDAMDGVKSESTVNSNADRVSVVEAQKIAENSVSLMSDGQSRSLDLSGGVKAICNGNDTLMYVFNFADNKGYSIVSASKKSQDFNIFTEQGNLDPSSVKDTAVVNWTKNFYVDKVMGPKTRTDRYEYCSSTIRYWFHDEETQLASIGADSNKKSLFSDYVNGRSGYYTRESTSFSESSFTSAITGSQDYILCFEKGGNKYYATSYGKIRTVQYCQVMFPGSSQWTTYCYCTSYDRGEKYYVYTDKNGYTTKVNNLSTSGISNVYKVRKNTPTPIYYTGVQNVRHNGNYVEFDVTIANNETREIIVEISDVSNGTKLWKTLSWSELKSIMNISDHKRHYSYYIPFSHCTVLMYNNTNGRHSCLGGNGF